MKFMNTNQYFLALATLFAIGIVGCGSDSLAVNVAIPDPNPLPTPPPSPDPDPVPDPNRPSVMNQPVVAYNFYVERSEELLKLETNYGYMIAKTRQGFKPSNFESHGIKVVSSFGDEESKYYYLQKESGVMDALKKVRSIPGVAYVEPDILHHPTAEVETHPFEYTNPDPAVLTNQYGVYATHTVDAWKEYGFGSHTPVVANIDGGVAYDNLDLKDVVEHAYSWYETDGYTLAVPSFTDDPPLEDWKLTRPDNLNGTDTLLGDAGHGTNTCGIMAAKGNNGIAVAGMCWQVRLISYKAMPDQGKGSVWPVYGSLWHLAKWKKANNYNYTIPVNMSLGSTGANQFALDMLQLALQNDIIIVASSGNDFVGNASYPGSYSGVIRVGATNSVDKRGAFSSYGPDLSVMAPGTGVVSTGQPKNSTSDTAPIEYNRTNTMTGTSQAAPHVTGLIGYMLTFNPNLKPDQIKTYIEQNADFVGGKTGFDIEYGWGRINTLKTVGAIINDLRENNPPPSEYVRAPLKVKVFQRDPNGVLASTAVNGANVYLYSCTETGTITNYVACSITGSSRLDRFSDPNSPSELGVAYFDMLKPGYYKVMAGDYYFSLDEKGTVAAGGETDIFRVIHTLSDVQEKSIYFDSPGEFMYIQTYPTQNQDNGVNGNAGSGSLDNAVSIWDPVTGNKLYSYDYDYFDTIVTLKPKKTGTYVVGVEALWAPLAIALIGGRWCELGGEYALCISDTMKNGAAPLSWANAGAARGHGNATSPIPTLGNALPIAKDQVLYGVLPSRSRVDDKGDPVLWWLTPDAYNPDRIRHYYTLTIR